MTTTEPTADALELRRLMHEHNRALGRMPYGASAGFRYFTFAGRHADDVDNLPTAAAALELVVDNLNRLADRLGGVAERAAANESELVNLRGELAAAGRLGARMVELAERAQTVEADNPLVGALNRQREALEAIGDLVADAYAGAMLEASAVAGIVIAALAAGIPPTRSED